jgi:hypothetical protein
MKMPANSLAGIFVFGYLLFIANAMKNRGLKSYFLIIIHFSLLAQ